jgi:predicted nucleic acid-binding protein
MATRTLIQFDLGSTPLTGNQVGGAWINLWPLPAAVLDANDARHGNASRVWTDLLDDGTIVQATNYVLIETFALAQAHLGLDAVRVFSDDVVSILRVTWVDGAMHRAAATALPTAQRRSLSLVDCVSFEAMRTLGLERAFAFDRHFREQGFPLVPSR